MKDTLLSSGSQGYSSCSPRLPQLSTPFPYSQVLPESLPAGCSLLSNSHSSLLFIKYNPDPSLWSPGATLLWDNSDPAITQQMTCFLFLHALGFCFGIDYFCNEENNSSSSGQILPILGPIQVHALY